MRDVAFTSLAGELATFLSALHVIDPADGPAPGLESFYRGGPLVTYDEEIRRAAGLLDGRVDVTAAMHVWERALQSSWSQPPVWVHGT